MAVPGIEVRVSADTKSAEAGLKRVEGAIDATGNAARRTATQSAAMGGAMGKIGGNAVRLRGQVQNAAFQLGDFATQVGAGTSASVALGQQLPQLLGGFGALGAVMGAAVAVGVPLAASFIDIGANAESTEDAIDRLTEAMEGLDEVASQLEASLDEQIARYGSARVAILELAEAQAALRLADARQAFSEVAAELESVSTGLFVIGPRMRGVSNAMRQLADDFGLSMSQAMALNDAFAQLAQAEGVEAQAAAAQRFFDTMESLNIEVDKLPPEFRRALDELITLNLALVDAEAAAQRLASASAGVTFGDPNALAGLSGAELLPPTGGEDDGGSGGRRGGRRQEDRIGALARSLMTESELLESWRSESLEKLADFNALELEAIGGHNEAKLRLEEEYQNRLAGIEQSERKMRLDSIKGALGDAASLMRTENEKLFKIGKAAALANAAISGYEAATEAWNKGMKVGGPPVAAAFTAASLARTGALISQISSQSFNSGGGGAGAAGGGAAATPAAPAPLDVRLSGVSPDTLVSGADLGNLLDRLNDEAGDRGFRLMIAT